MTQKEHDKKVTELMTSLVEAERQIQDIRKELDELDKVDIELESRRWRPDLGQIYYLVSDTGSVAYTIWYNSNCDLLRFAIGNVFKTKEEVEFEIERLKVIAELKEFAEPDDRQWNNHDCHWAIRYKHNISEMCIEQWTLFHTNLIYFESREKAEEAINAVGEDRIKKYYLRVRSD